MTPDLDPIGKWKQFYEHSTQTQPYGHIQTYEMAAKFLDDGNLVEDWGCGYAYAKQFFKKSKYVGIDGTKSIHCDVVDDLRTRKSTPPNVLLRGVLEHNLEWRSLLTNVTRCAQEKLCIIFFMDFLPEQGPVMVDPKSGIPAFQLCEKDVLELMGGWNIVRQPVPLPDGKWHVWYCTRK